MGRMAGLLRNRDRPGGLCRGVSTAGAAKREDKSMHTTIVRSGLLGLALATFLGTGPAALAEVITYKAALAAQGNDSKGTGNAEVTYDTTTKMGTWRVTFDNLTGPPTPAHF